MHLHRASEVITSHPTQWPPENKMLSIAVEMDRRHPNVDSFNKKMYRRLENRCRVLRVSKQSLKISPKNSSEP